MHACRARADAGAGSQVRRPDRFFRDGENRLAEPALRELPPGRRPAAAGRRRPRPSAVRAARPRGARRNRARLRHLPRQGQPAGELRPAHAAGRLHRMALAAARAPDGLRRRRRTSSLRAAQGRPAEPRQGQRGPPSSRLRGSALALGLVSGNGAQASARRPRRFRQGVEVLDGCRRSVPAARIEAVEKRGPSADRALPAVLLTLTMVTGVVDAASFLGLGHIFTANMTGNIVFLGFAVAGAPGLSFARSGIALAAFAAGAVLGGRMEARMRAGRRHLWASSAFALEAALLLASAAVAAASGNDLTERGTVLYVVIVLTGLAMGIRNPAVRKLGVADLTTTVLTLGIAGLAADSSLAGGANPGWLRRSASVVSMFAGAALGAWLLRASVAWALGIAAAIVAACA